MRKVFLFMMTTLDGYFEGEGHDISWHNVDDEFNSFANKQLDETDTLVFGHRTYELMADFWPSEQAMQAASETANRMNALHKIVFSRQPMSPKWKSTVAYDDIDELKEVKKKAGKSIAILGSSNLSVSLLQAGILDEMRIMVNPVSLGKGTSLLDGLIQFSRFKLTDTRSFHNGNVLLRYNV